MAFPEIEVIADDAMRLVRSQPIKMDDAVAAVVRDVITEACQEAYNRGIDTATGCLRASEEHILAERISRLRG